mgnify:CR=1 FL=1
MADSDLLSHIVKMAYISKASLKYGELKRMLDNLADVKLPIDVDVSVRSEVMELIKGRDIKPCLSTDPLLTSLLKCSKPDNRYVNAVILGDCKKELTIRICSEPHYSPYIPCYDEWLFADTLGGAYILYVLSRYKSFMQTLDELEKKNEEARRAVDNLKAVIDFMDSIVKEINEPTGEFNDLNDLQPDGNVVETAYSILLQSIKTGDVNKELLFGILSAPAVVQTVGSVFKPSHMRLISKYYSFIADAYRIMEVELKNEHVEVTYANRYGRIDTAYIHVGFLIAADALLLIDLEENYGTLTYFAKAVTNRVKRMYNAAEYAKELATAIKLVGGGP